MDPLEDGSVSLDLSEVSAPVRLKPGILQLQLAVLLLQVVSLLPLSVQLKENVNNMVNCITGYSLCEQK